MKIFIFVKARCHSENVRKRQSKVIWPTFFNNPRYSQQQLDVLISCGNYYFHIPPTKDDIQNLENLGHLDDHVRNPKTVFPLKEAKRVLQLYTGLKQPKQTNRSHRKPLYQKPVFKRLGE